MNEGDIRILKTASENLQSNNILKASIAVRQLNDWYNNHSNKEVLDKKAGFIFKLCSGIRVSIDNLDTSKFNKDKNILIKELDKLADNFSKRVPNDGILVKTVKKAILRDLLPETEVVIIPKEGSIDVKTHYLRVLGSALREELSADCCSLHCKDDIIELQADLSGSKDNVKKAVEIIASGVTNAFELSSGIKVDYVVKLGSSDLELLTSKESETQFRKFAFKMWNE